MSYDYQIERPKLFSDQGQKQILDGIDLARECLETSGAAIVDKLLIPAGDSWRQLAIVDRLVELGYLTYVFTEGARQNWVLVAGPKGLP